MPISSQLKYHPGNFKKKKKRSRFQLFENNKVKKNNYKNSHSSVTQHHTIFKLTIKQEKALWSQENLEVES